MSSPDRALAALIEPLPDFARAAFVSDATRHAPPPQTIADLFERVHRWAIGAGIAEGRGGFPGGGNAPGWSDYVDLQRMHVAVFKALVAAFGPPAPALVALFQDYDRSFPASIRRMGDGYAPHVDDVAGRLIYSLPVESGFVSASFAYPICETDLAVLLDDPYRRAALEVVAHTLLQESMIRGNRAVTELDFAKIRDDVLHSTPQHLTEYLAGIAETHNIVVDHFIRQAMTCAAPPTC